MEVLGLCVPPNFLFFFFLAIFDTLSSSTYKDDPRFCLLPRRLQVQLAPLPLLPTCMHLEVPMTGLNGSATVTA